MGLGAEFDGLEALAVGAAIGTGAAGFLAAVNVAVLFMPLKKQLFAHWTGDAPILMTNKAANGILMLNLD